MRYIKTSLRKVNFKGLLIGIILGALIVFPFTIRQYEVVKLEFVYTDSKSSFNDMYSFLYEDIGAAKDGDSLMISWFNITVTEHVIVQIDFDITRTIIYRIGLAYHINDTNAEVLYDSVLPESTVTYDFDVVQYGLYSCSVFMKSLNNSLVSITVLALVS